MSLWNIWRFLLSPLFKIPFTFFIPFILTLLMDIRAQYCKTSHIPFCFFKWQLRKPFWDDYNPLIRPFNICFTYILKRTHILPYISTQLGKLSILHMQAFRTGGLVMVDCLPKWQWCTLLYFDAAELDTCCWFPLS